MTDPLLSIQNLSVKAGTRSLLNDVSLDIPSGGVFGLIGPSGAGKSTLLKSINRLIELTPGITVAGNVKLNGTCVYGRSTDPDDLRTKIGMLFQQPVIFPTSIFENVVFGVKRLGTIPRHQLLPAAEKALKEAAIWDEVKDRLNSSASRLSTGQQQRLCLARTLICRPEVILMDEPTSALDSRSTEIIEELISKIGKSNTIILVTHQLSQVSRICNHAALLDGGRVVIESPAREILESSQLRSLFSKIL